MKKILSLFVLLMTIVIGAKADDVYKFQLNGANKEIINGTTTSGASQYFSYNSSKHNFNTKFNGCTYDGVAYTSGLKMEGATQVSWTTTQTSTVTIVQSTWSTNTIKFDGTELAVSGAEAITGGRVYTISNVTAGAHSMTRGSGESGVFAIYVTEASSKTVTDITLDGVKIDGSTATETTDYTISGTTITLTGSYSIAPEVSLTEKTTYDEGDPTTKDIAVTLTKGEAYFTGSAKIGAGTDYETEYTIQVPVSTAATLEADVTALTVSSPKVATGTAKFNVVGANLTGESVSLAFGSAVDGLTVSPASITITEGAVNQEVTVSYYSTEDVSETIANLTITSTGVDAITIPVTYSSTAGIETVTPISDSNTWDWSTAASATIASPDGNNVVVFANADGWNASFNAEAIAGKTNNFYSSKSAYKYCQGSILKFNTTLPGTVSIDFSNTGSKSEYRWLAVNGAVTEYKSKDETKVTTAEIAVPAGDVIIEAILGTSAETAPEYTAANTMLNFRKVVFTADNGKADSDLAVDPAETSVNMQETTDVTYTTSSTGAVTVESSNPAVATATVDATNKTITISGLTAGQATITVSQEADDNYNAGSKEIAVTVINPNIKTVYDVTGLTSDEFVLAKANIGGTYGTSADNQFVTVSTDNITQNISEAGYEGTFYNMSKTDRYITFKVKGAENFRVLVKNNTAGRSYTVKVGSADAETVTHGGTGREFSEFFETGSTGEVTITIAGDGSGSVYPLSIQFNVPQTEITLNSKGFATYSSAYDFEFKGADAYGMKLTATSLVGTKVTSGKVKAGEGILFKGEAGATVTITETTGAEAIGDANNLIGTTNASEDIISSSYNYMYSLSGDTFLPFTGTLQANKAFFGSDTAIANSLDMVFEDEATAINNVSANEVNAVAPVKVIKNGKLYIGNYNVAGQQVK